MIDAGAVSDTIQNGAPDGIALVDGNTNTLVDALSYEGGMTSVDLPGVGTVSLVEGTVLATATADNNTSVASLCRMPNGSDTDDANTDWKICATLTPWRREPALTSRRAGSPPERADPGPRQDEVLDRLREAFVRVGRRDMVGLALHVVAGVRHGDAQAGGLEHLHVVGHVADGGDAVGGYRQLLREVADHVALVGLRVRHVQVVGLRARCIQLCVELLHRLFAAGHPVVVVAAPRRSSQRLVQQRVEVVG